MQAPPQDTDPPPPTLHSPAFQRLVIHQSKGSQPLQVSDREQDSPGMGVLGAEMLDLNMEA